MKFLLLTLVALCGSDFALGHTYRAEKAKQEANGLEMAVRTYVHDYARFPVPPSNSKQIVRVLLGKNRELNPRGTIYLELDTADLDGTYLDPWGTQYLTHLDEDDDRRLTLYGSTYETPCIVQSAGPDATFGTWDDIFSRSASRWPADINPETLRRIRQSVYFPLIILVCLFAAIAIALVCVRSMRGPRPKADRCDIAPDSKKY